ncbi:MAG: type II toxin-antitoxin system RelE/ParE family toxin [Verrucomicrobia bacterium]|nr:type II toxin-antitoxin system RelE/ParE family toxin [Verrucomicrobiota bacterium]
MKVRVLRPALDDLLSGRRFYDRQAPGIGGYFFEQLFSEIDSLVLTAGIHRHVFGFNRLLAKRFPYAVYYRVIANEAVVFRVLDCRRDPQWILRELKEK